MSKQDRDPSGQALHRFSPTPCPALPRLLLAHTWDLEVEVTGAANSGDGRCLPAPGDAFLHAALASNLHSEGASCRGERASQSSHTARLQPPDLSLPSHSPEPYLAHACQQT